MALAETAKMIAELSFKDKLTPGVNKAIGSVGKLESSFGRVGKGAGQLAGGALRVGTAVAATAITLAGAASKIGMDFDDAFAGVKKTVTASESDLASLRKSLVSLSTRVPINFTDLAGIAQEAGALGVATKDVDKFTEAVARTSAATVGLSTGEAAEAFGKLGNIFHLQGQGYSQLGSALVELGNSAASSEGDIIAVAERFGAVGKAAGLSADQVLGWSSAIASLGPEAEAAGSSLSRVFGRVIQYAGTGDKKLNTFAKTAGVTAKQFKAMLKVDPSSAMLQFLKGLGKMDKFKLSKTLKEAGITNIRDINAIQLLSQNTDLLTSSLKTSGKAWKDNTALVDVSEKRFDTFKNHLIELKNTGFAAADAFAGGLNPALDRLSKKAATFVSTHMDDFVKIGKEFGKAVDDIDWGKVQSGAQTALDVASAFLEILKKVPPELIAIGAGFAGINKLSGGLLGAGAGNIVGGLAGAIAKGVASKAPIVGSLFAQPVFVTNWPLGGIGGGIGAGAAGAGFAGAAAMTAAGAILIPTVLAAVQSQVIQPALQGQATGNAGATSDVVARGNVAEMTAALHSLDTLPDRLDPLQSALYNLNANGVKVHTEVLKRELKGALIDANTGRGDHTAGVSFKRISDPVDARGDRLLDTVAKGKDIAEFKASNDSLLAKNHDAAVAIGASVDAGASATRSAVDGAKSGITGAVFSGTGMIAAAVRNNPPPIVNVKVSVTPAGVEKTTTIVNRYGPQNGSAGSNNYINSDRAPRD